MTPSVKLFVCVALVAAIVPFFRVQQPQVIAPDKPPEWPREFHGKSLLRLPLSKIEQRFTDDFPGSIARFHDGEREIVIRWVSRPTRKLHPARDCYRASGFTIEETAVNSRADETPWTHFLAIADTRTIRVQEHIVDQSGRVWLDVSQWYWAAWFGRSKGPWQMITLARRE